MGFGLYRAFVDAGLPPPMMHLESPIGACRKLGEVTAIWQLSFRVFCRSWRNTGLRLQRQVDRGDISPRGSEKEVLVSKRPFFLAVAYNRTCHTSNLKFKEQVER